MLGPDATDSPRARPGVSLALLALPVVILVVMGWEHRWMSDDGYIHLRVVQQLLHGNGLVFNAGERVEASTSPAWVLLLAAVKETVLRPLALPWIAVVLGIGFSGLGLALAETGAVRLGSRAGLGTLQVPVGAAVVVAFPPFWDFATSGLETGFALAWLGGAFVILARIATAPGPSRWWVRFLEGLALGLGPLVRPDLGVFWLLFSAAAVACCWRDGWRRRLPLAFGALLLPVGYQLFRMAYYALLVPNTALAKEASRSWWAQGYRYLRNFGDPYWVWVALAAVLLLVVVVVLRAARTRDWRRALALACPAVAAVAHGLYVVRVGGDFFHARMLLPSLFALVMPVAAVPLHALVPRGGVERVLAAAAAAVVLVWAPVAGLALRNDVGFTTTFLGTRMHIAASPEGVSDERAYWVGQAGVPNPVTVADFARNRIGLTRQGEQAKRVAESGRRELVVNPDELGLARPVVYPLRDGMEPGYVITRFSVGMFAYAAGPDVYVADTLSLADPVGSHLRVHARGRPGHEKRLDVAWVVGRFARPGATAPRVPDARVRAARTALACGQLRTVLHDVRAPLSFSQALDNIGDSFANTRLRFENQPDQARFELCGR